MKKITLLLVVLLVGLSTTRANNMVISTTEGQQYIVALEEMPKFTIEDGMLVVKGAKTDIAIPLQNVAKYVFADYSGVEAVEVPQTTFKYIDDKIVFEKCEHSRNVDIYSLSGMVLSTHTIAPGLGGYFDTSTLAPGIYIVKVDGITVKIAKK